MARPLKTPKEKPTRVQVGLGDVSLNKLMFVIAYEEGIYEKNGLEVQQFITPGAAEIIRRSGVNVPPALVRSGEEKAPISIGGGSPLMVYWTMNAQAVDRVIVACTDPVARWHIISRPDIADVQQLKGMRLGYSVYGAVTHFMAVAFSRMMGWDPNQDLSLMSGALNVEALKNGRVDAFVASEIHETMAVAAGFRKLVDLGKYNIPNAGSGINVARPWLKENQDAVQRFVKSAVDAIALLKNDKKVAFKGMAKWYNIKDPEKQEYLYREVSNIPRKPYPPVDGIKKVMEIYDNLEMRKYKPEYFYDDSFVRELDKNGYIDSLYP